MLTIKTEVPLTRQEHRLLYNVQNYNIEDALTVLDSIKHELLINNETDTSFTVHRFQDEELIATVENVSND